ncbi:DUF6934 family protein [Sphingobacterium luzhongxinii]|uniref:DUF6934 family protein n=1 Tax=Sphingobacterium luzhongxinii TaxID=2654181 RepID=UPI003F8D4A06
MVEKKSYKKVLSTVARAVLDFTEQNPQAIVMAEGSTPSGTRLYQRGISEFWNEIQALFEARLIMMIIGSRFERVRIIITFYNAKSHFLNNRNGF